MTRPPLIKLTQMPLLKISERRRQPTLTGAIDEQFKPDFNVKPHPKTLWHSSFAVIAIISFISSSSAEVITPVDLILTSDQGNWVLYSDVVSFGTPWPYYFGTLDSGYPIFDTDAALVDAGGLIAVFDPFYGDQCGPFSFGLRTDYVSFSLGGGAGDAAQVYDTNNNIIATYTLTSANPPIPIVISHSVFDISYVSITKGSQSSLVYITNLMLDVQPIVTTWIAGNANGSSATLSGNVTPNGLAVTTYFGIRPRHQLRPIGNK